MKKKWIKIMVMTAMLAALSVIFRLFLGYPQTGTTRYDLGFLPIAAAGVMFGPLWSGGAYVIADLIGTLLTGQTPIVTITICKFVFGAIFGLFFYKKDITLPRIVLCVAAISLFVDLIGMPLALMPLYNKGIFVIFVERLPQVGVMLPVRVAGIWLMDRYLGKTMKKYIS